VPGSAKEIMHEGAEETYLFKALNLMSTVKPFDLATGLIGGLLCNIIRIYFEWGCLAGFNLSFLLLHLQRDFNLVMMLF
jgi:hypothetical protein